MNEILNKSTVEIVACDETITIQSNETSVKKLELRVVKTAGCNITAVGHHINYCVSIRNESGVELYDLLFRDILDPHTSFVVGSFTVGGVPRIPEFQNNQLTYMINRLDHDQTVLICFRVRVDS